MMKYLSQQTDNFAYGLLDMVGLGVISRFIKTITDYAYGFVKLLDKLLGPFLLDNVETVGLYNILFGRGAGAGMGVLYLLMTIGYIYGAIYLWTGKDLRT